MVDGLEEWAGRRPVYRKLAARRRAPPRTCLPSTTNRLSQRLPSTVSLSIAGRATPLYRLPRAALAGAPSGCRAALPPWAGPNASQQRPGSVACTRSRCSKTTASPQLQTVERPRRPSRVDTSGRGGGGYEASTRDVSRCCNRARSCARCRPWRLVLRWLPLEAVKASYWHRVNLGDTDELVGGLIGSEGVLWPRLVADTVCGRLTRRSVGLVVCRRGLVRGGRERPWWSKCECSLSK